jgi:hypothetical protein
MLWNELHKETDCHNNLFVGGICPLLYEYIFLAVSAPIREVLHIGKCLYIIKYSLFGWSKEAVAVNV